MTGDVLEGYDVVFSTNGSNVVCMVGEDDFSQDLPVVSIWLRKIYAPYSGNV